MGKAKYPSPCGVPMYAGLILTTCALIVLSGCVRSACGVPAVPVHKTGPHNSPITVADGSMVVRTRESFDVTAHTVNVSSGQACLIVVSSCPRKRIRVKGMNWTITSSSDANTQIGTTDGGRTIVAKGPHDRNLDDDGTDGHGKEFGYGMVKFSPATLKFADGRTRSLDCKMNKCRIEIYYVVP